MVPIAGCIPELGRSWNQDGIGWLHRKRSVGSGSGVVQHIPTVPRPERPLGNSAKCGPLFTHPSPPLHPSSLLFRPLPLPPSSSSSSSLGHGHAQAPADREYQSLSAGEKEEWREGIQVPGHSKSMFPAATAVVERNSHDPRSRIFHMYCM
jgi:hypothetical protein